MSRRLSVLGYKSSNMMTILALLLPSVVLGGVYPPFLAPSTDGHPQNDRHPSPLSEPIPKEYKLQITGETQLLGVSIGSQNTSLRLLPSFDHDFTAVIGRNYTECDNLEDGCWYNQYRSMEQGFFRYAEPEKVDSELKNTMTIQLGV